MYNEECPMKTVFCESIYNFNQYNALYMPNVECNISRMYAAYDLESTMQASLRTAGTPIQIHYTI